MTVEQQILQYIDSQPAMKRDDMKMIHEMILQVSPLSKLWFLDGRNSDGKVVSNPNIGYGTRTMIYADGRSQEFYHVGLSANTSGISVYIMGIEDKSFLKNKYGNDIGNASITGYCIKFKSLKNIDAEILKSIIIDAFDAELPS